MSWLELRRDLVNATGSVPTNISVTYTKEETLVSFLGSNPITLRIPLNEEGDCILKDFFLPQFILVDDWLLGGKYYRIRPNIFLQNVVKQRLRMILGCDAPRFYAMPSTELLRLDILNWSQLMLYQTPVLPNAQRKFAHRCIVVRRWKDTGQYNDGIPTKFQCLGDCLRPEFTSRNLDEIVQDVNALKPSPMNATSPSKGVYLLPPKLENGETDYLDSPGYVETEREIRSIFGNVLNLTERIKLAVATDAIPVQNPSSPLVVGSKDKEPDNCCINALVVFDHSQDVNQEKPLYLATGEIPCSKKFAEIVCHPRAVKQLQAEEIIVKPGDFLDRDGTVGFMDGKPVVIETDFRSYTVESIKRMPGLNFWKFTIAGNSPLAVSRIVSPLGLKGVTVPKKSLGHITYDGQNHGVQLVVGPSSIKGKVNTIALAKLCLKAKLINKVYDINAMSEEEINLEIADIPMVDWHHPDGRVEKVHAGILPIYVTVMGSEVCTVGKQKIMPETLLMFAREGHHEIVEELIKLGANELHWEVLSELLELLYDNGTINPDLPVWSADDPVFKSMISNGIIDTSTFGGSVISNPLLNENNKGYYLVIENTVVRMPSAKLINSMTEIIKHTGEVRRPTFFRSASRILINVRQSQYGQSNTTYVNRNINDYRSNIISELSGKDGLINRLCTPKIPGISALQVSDYRVPMGVTVVTHRRLQKKLDSATYVEIGVRNPVLWRAQLDTRQCMSLHDFEKHCEYMGFDIEDIIIPEYSECCVLRNPWDIMLAQGDCDGDLHPVAIPGNSESIIQELLADFAGTAQLIDEENDWIEEYIKGELDNSILDGDIAFKWYTFRKEDYFTHGLIESASAKMMIGPATTSKWILEAVVEAFATKKELVPKIVFAIQKLMQDNVVRGIKHSTTGDFGVFMIHRVVRTSTQKTVIEMLRSAGLSDTAISVFLNCVSKLSPECEMGRAATELRGIIGTMTGSVQSRDGYTGAPKEFSLAYLNTDIYDRLPHSTVLSRVKAVTDSVMGKIKEEVTAKDVLARVFGRANSAEIKSGGEVGVDLSTHTYGQEWEE